MKICGIFYIFLSDLDKIRSSTGPL